MTSPTSPEPSPIRGGDGSTPDDLLDCANCPHLGVFHNLSTTKPRRRTACSTSSGPQATPCPCKRFTPSTTGDPS